MTVTDSRWGHGMIEAMTNPHEHHLYEAARQDDARLARIGRKVWTVLAVAIALAALTAACVTWRAEKAELEEQQDQITGY